MNHEELREMCAVDGDWGGTEWGEVILRLLDRRNVTPELQHKPFGLTHRTWARPDCFLYDSAEEAAAAAVRTYGPNSGHVVVGVVGFPEPVCTCSTDPLDRMPLIDGRCPKHSLAADGCTPPAQPDGEVSA